MEMFDGSRPLDEDLGVAMDVAYTILSALPDNNDTEDQLRARIVAYNLRALANVLLLADDNPEVLEVNLKQVVLGILGTSDWLLKHLPSIDEAVVKNESE